jgi:hypothetical protein
VESTISFDRTFGYFSGKHRLNCFGDRVHIEQKVVSVCFSGCVLWGSVRFGCNYVSLRTHCFAVIVLHINYL